MTFRRLPEFFVKQLYIWPAAQRRADRLYPFRELSSMEDLAESFAKSFLNSEIGDERGNIS